MVRRVIRVFLKYFYDEKLAQASYMVGCQATGEALVIDPSRDVTMYEETAVKEGFRIVAATETHIHADFVSGARELAVNAGAKLYLSGEGDAIWRQQYTDGISFQWVHDGDTFKIGNLTFDVMHTPGHTPESLSFLVHDGGGGIHREAMGIFSGDFVFVGDIGRPDLLEKAVGVSGSSEQGAKQMYQSIQRFKKLPDHLQVWPGHGAGSACGKALGAIPSSTVGYEKLFNWAMADLSEEEFIQKLLEGQPEPPRYFAQMKKLNVEGPALLSDLPAIPLIDSAAVKTAIAERGQVVDTRSAAAFRAGHLPGTINIPYNKSFITWAGWLLSYEQPIYLLAESGQQSNIVRDLRSIGFDNVAGIASLDVVDVSTIGGEELESYREITPQEALSLLKQGDVTWIDVRNDAEWAEGYIDGAKHLMLGKLQGRLTELPEDKNHPIVVQCQSGARSSIAASVLQREGFKNVINMAGGFGRWLKEELPYTKEKEEKILNA